MANVFNFEDYKDFVLAHVSELPGNGHGEMQRMATHIRIHPTAVSQIFKGRRDLNLEQATELAEYLDLNESQSRYLLLLVSFARAGSEKLKRVLRKQIETMQIQSKQLVHRMPKSKVLSDGDRAIFYSSWQYSAVRLMTSIPDFQSVPNIASELGLSNRAVQDIVDFLVSRGLCVEQNGKVMMGPQHTHIEASSNLAPRHHSNWRIKAIESFSSLNHDRELSFTAPVSLKKSDLSVLRKMILEFIDQCTKLVTQSPPETVACLNIDLFEV